MRTCPVRRSFCSAPWLSAGKCRWNQRSSRKPASAAQMEGDAFAALARLRADRRIDPARIGVMGVSKGGGATLNTAIAVRQRWRNGFPHLFDLHVAICPGATAQHRDPTTQGRPMFFMLAGRDDYTPAPLAVEYAER